jgi:hypothetical protein
MNHSGPSWGKQSFLLNLRLNFGGVLLRRFLSYALLFMWGSKLIHITYLILLLFYSMEQSPSWEANRSSASLVFYGTWKFITAFTSARHLSLSWASSIQCIPPHPIFWISILTLSSHLCLDLFPSGFPTKTMYTPLLFPIRATWHTHLILLALIRITKIKYTSQSTSTLLWMVEWRRFIIMCCIIRR